MNWSACISSLETLGWSLTGIGKAIGLSPQAVSDIKQGRTKAPSGMAAVRLHDLHERGEGPPRDTSEPTTAEAA
ncbi:XRE family transcriptional regulator [Pseudoxanthomonas winnipegensis]|uniref:helix-turn-helix domain-containing protein n=1 Tax=Pseudoxanthomonas winnipegensis TaxID=2480810 RepID=UPI00102DE0D2|nr:helix-turn-helix transcriptional regulator [Pseudoxanthomonas winnipegensis]TAA42168.1 XRE family transcriptional regulator [Pseudoxanthomonas winnipegensis]